MAEAEPSAEAKSLPRLGSYILERQLGSGGMSNVFRAIHEGSGSVVAVKVLPRTLAKNATLLQRFIREAKSAEALDHPNIVAIYDRGYDQGRHYLVLEFVEGRDLHDRVRLNGPMGPTESIKLIREVAEGLRYAAGRGMIHRDVKPANLLIDSDGKAKIIDLGLALQTEEEDERVTRDGTTVGTVDYMAPEQARDSRKTSERSDIYSLGCTFYYLLTGSAPYPGGGLAEKLARHHSAPIPDVRDRRPEIASHLAQLVQRMMAKKPEGRFDDYTHLIAALDALGNPAARPTGPVALDALIADDDDDEGDFIQVDPPGPTLPGKSGQVPARPASTAAFLTAEIVDDDDDDDEGGPPSTWPTTRPKPASRPTLGQVVSLSDLASLDGDDEDVPRAAKRPPSQVRTAAPAKASSPSFEDLVGSEAEAEEVAGRISGPRRAGGDDLSIKTWIAAAVMVGLGIALVGVGLSFVLNYFRGEPEIAAVPTESAATEGDGVAAPATPVAPRPTRPSPPKKPAKAQAKVEIATDPPPSILPEVIPDEKLYPADVEARLIPAWPRVEIPRTARIEVVRRVPGAGDDPSVPLLAAAFGKTADIVEIADTGPFFEDDFQLPGRSRIVRARPGLRPIIKVELPTQQTLKEHEAKFLLGGTRLESLVLEGLDLVVDVRDLPLQQATLFACQGAEVTLRDCTLTIYNGGDRKLTIFRLAEGARANRLVLERTTIRGPIRTLVEVASARAEILIDRSVVVGDSGPLISLEPSDRPSRSIHLIRSLLTTRGPLIDWSVGKPGPVAIKALGSTVARVDGPGVAALMHTRSAFAGAVSDLVSWSGADNALAGWPAVLTSGPDSSILAAHLDGIRVDPITSTAGPDREVGDPWADSSNRDEVAAADFYPLAPGLRPTLARVARPHPLLRELTVDLMRPLPTPGLATGPVPFPNVATRVGVRPVAQPQDLTFDLAAAPFFGDLGKFLEAKVTDPSIRHTVRLRGGGNAPYAMTPIRLPDGCAVAILGNASEGSKLPLPTFSPTPGTVGRPLIEIRGGDLALTDVGFASDGVTRPGNWIRAEDSILALRHCRFRDPGGPDANVGPVIAFIARRSSPIASRQGSLGRATDRPTAILKNCLIWTGGDALSAEVARGVVALDNCLVIAGNTAIALQPVESEAGRFEADLALDRCTVADDRTGFLLKPSGSARTPDRPWLISTRSCVFPKTQRDPTGGLIAVDPETFARGVLFWQSIGDAYEVGRFLASTGAQPSGTQPPVDVKKQWIDLWGGEHTRSDHGPDPRHNDRFLRYKDKDHPKPGRVFPLAFELDAKIPALKDLGVSFKDLPAPPAR